MDATAAASTSRAGSAKGGCLCLCVSQEAKCTVQTCVPQHRLAHPRSKIYWYCFWLVYCSDQAGAVAPSGLRIHGQTFTRRLKHVTESGSSNVHWAAHHLIISSPAVVNTHRSWALWAPFSRRAKHTPALTALNLSSMHAPPSVRPK